MLTAMMKFPFSATMRHPGRTVFACVMALVLLMVACAGLEKGGGVSTGKAEDRFQTVVKPLFEHRCVWCHNEREPHGGLNLQDRELVLRPGSKFVVAGQPGKSLLYTAISRHPRHLKAMPIDGWKITEEQARAIRDWIAGGAPWPEGSGGTVRKKNYRVDLDDYL